MIDLLKEMALTGGEWVIYILIVCSVAAVAVMIERGIILYRERKEMEKVKEKLRNLLGGTVSETWSQHLSSHSGLTASVVRSGLEVWSHGADSVEEQMASVTFSEKRRLEARMIILGTLGNNAIYIGLFGTVLGVIKAFHDLAEGGGAGPEVVMQGLSEALIATAVGLLVALPCVIAYNILQKGIKDILSETEAISRLLLARSKSR
ncbi:MAG: MotA/TolQ/ExbB proton channel family protein [Elusimicrobia bacterium]|nr:MotA/TolQ/ExbB proton channel family protein [Elusimicrobiota bacterium]